MDVNDQELDGRVGKKENISQEGGGNSRRSSTIQRTNSTNSSEEIIDSISPACLLDENGGDNMPPKKEICGIVDWNGHQYSPATVSAFATDRSSKIEAPTSENIEPYLNSLAHAPRANNSFSLQVQGMNGKGGSDLTDMDRKMPATKTLDSSQTSRGRERHRNSTGEPPPNSDGFVPPRFVHVPKNAATLDETKRAPSVPDLISYLTSHNEQRLSDETLRGKGRESRREQFEERLRLLDRSAMGTERQENNQPEERWRRAHPRMSWDAESSATRYRSKSTPSRPPGGHLVRTNLRQLATANGSNLHENICFGSPPSTPLVAATGGVSSGQPISNKADNGTSNITLANSFVKSSDGSCSARTLSGASSEGRANMLEPPPPPPPATEKERLVERERQARLERERARRRHIALLRERRLEESGDAAENEQSDAAIGQVSFDAGMQLAPEFVGDNDLLLDLPAVNSYVDSSFDIPRPPLPLPPTTERERLVQREREARYEIERARRRHSALHRESQLDGNDYAEEVGIDELSLERSATFSNCLVETPGNRATSTLHNSTEADKDGSSHELSTTSVICAEVQNTDGEANSLSYPMERFLERVDDEGPNMLPIDVGTVDGDTVALPYTMELFLAENAVLGPTDETISESERVVTVVSQVHQANGVIGSPVTVPNVLPNIAAETNPNEILPATIGYIDGVNASISAAPSILSPSLVDQNAAGNQNERHLLNPNSSLAGDFRAGSSWVSDPSPSHISITPSRGSLVDDPHPLRPITEADIAQLAEVEHASTGNAAPQSVRDEPSVPSVLGRGSAFLDQAFSVATQTTVVESATDASEEGRVRRVFSDIDESVESLNIVRVDPGGSVRTSENEAGGASSASIAAMPSSDSSDNMDATGSHLPLGGISDSLSHSMVRGSGPSSDDVSQLPGLTETDIVAMTDIDYASIGNAPPQSVRDERLSESSVTERGGRQFGAATPLTQIGAVDDGPFSDCVVAESLLERSECSSVEAMPSERADPGSVDSLSSRPANASVEVMAGDRSDRSFTPIPSDSVVRDIDVMRDSDEEHVIYQASDMGSSASIEALPSIDFENEVCLHNYGAIEAENHMVDLLREPLETDLRDCELDVESAPLLSAKTEEQMRSLKRHRSTPSALECNREEKMTQNVTCIGPSIVLVIAELPTFMVILQSNWHVCSLLGIKRYQIVLASLVIVTPILNHSSTGSEAQTIDQSLIRSELWMGCLLGILLGLLLGLIGFAICELDVWFGMIVSLSTAASAVFSRLCRLLLMQGLKKLNHSHHPRTMWTKPVMLGCQNFVTCVTLLQLASALCIVRPFEHFDSDDMC